jgi:hypothetical protein
MRVSYGPGVLGSTPAMTAGASRSLVVASIVKAPGVAGATYTGRVRQVKTRATIPRPHDERPHTFFANQST